MTEVISGKVIGQSGIQRHERVGRGGRADRPHTRYRCGARWKRSHYELLLNRKGLHVISYPRRT